MCASSLVRRSMRATPPVTRALSALAPTDVFAHRHIGPSDADIDAMLKVCGLTSLSELTDVTVPAHIRLGGTMKLDDPMSETEALALLDGIISKNEVKKSFIGTGYYETITPGVILRNILENPGWYTSYTPYQAEIAQGRLEMLLNYQTMVSDLTGMPMANASLLDEATAAAEAMTMSFALTKGKRNKFFIGSNCHPQTIALLQTRAKAVDIEITVGDPHSKSIVVGRQRGGGGRGQWERPRVLGLPGRISFLCSPFCCFTGGDFVFDDTVAGVLVQYPDTTGSILDYKDIVAGAHGVGALVVAATDLMALTQIAPPGEWGADIAVGSAQRFGVPMGFGGPHAGFMATSDKYARRMPGRIIGVTIDSRGKPALRMAMQTREQHIRRDKATSNICTAQALLANMAAAYGIYHGPEGLKAISARIHAMATTAAAALEAKGLTVNESTYFDTFTISGVDSAAVQAKAAANGCNVRVVDGSTVGLNFGEGHVTADISAVLKAFDVDMSEADLEALADSNSATKYGSFARSSEFLTHPVFNSHHSESQMLRFLAKLEKKDLSLNHSMIPLGSCTMKLNATSEMRPVTWDGIANMHPFAPADQTTGYMEMIEDLNKVRLTCELALPPPPSSSHAAVLFFFFLGFPPDRILRRSRASRP